MTPEQERALAIAEAAAKAAAAKGNEPPARQTDPRENLAVQGLSGVNQGMANILGAPVDLVNAGLGLGMAGVNKLAGTDFRPSGHPLGGRESIADLFNAISGQKAIVSPSDRPAAKFVRRVGEEIGSNMIPAVGLAGKAQKPIQVIADALLSSTGAGVGAATANAVAPGNPTADLIGETIGGLGTAGTVATVRKIAADRAARAAVPTIQQLKDQASALYDQAEKLGVTATQQQTQGLASDMRAIASNEGLISPTGRVSEAYPKAREALHLFDDYAQGTMTVPQMKTVRKVLTDAAKSGDDAERRIAAMMLDRFDDFTGPLAPPLEQARAIYHQAMKADTLDTLDQLAGSRAGQFTGSGYENARRTEYRGLERRIIKGDERGFTPAETDAISAVAQGTPASNAFRNIGRMAPTGPVSFMSSVGLPYMAGTAVGGPAVGTALSGASAGLSYGARGVANALGGRAAENASLLVRNGAVIPKAALMTDAERRVIAALLASEAARAGASGP